MGLYDTIIGPLLLGAFRSSTANQVNTFLYGLVTYQFAAYHRTKFNDPPWMKYMVLSLFILDTFHSASIIYLTWYYTVANYSNPTALTVGIWPYTFTPIGTVLAALGTQTYLGLRIRRLTNSQFLHAIVILLAILSFIFGVICSIEAWIIELLSELSRLTPLVIAWLSTQVAVDMLITVTLVVVFSRSRTGFRKTDTILNRLIRCAIQTGLFASIFCMGDLLSFILLPNTNIYGMFAFPLGRIYTNTLLDTLLTRELLQMETDSTDNPSVMVDSMYWPSTTLLQPNSTVQSTSIQLAVPRTTLVQTEGPSSSEVTVAKVSQSEV